MLGSVPETIGGKGSFSDKYVALDSPANMPESNCSILCGKTEEAVITSNCQFIRVLFICDLTFSQVNSGQPIFLHLV